MHLLAVQEIHDGLQDVVSLLDHAAIGRDRLTFDLGEDVPHLPDVVLNLGLKTTTPPQNKAAFLVNRLLTRPQEHKETHLTAKMWLRSSMTLLSLFCSSLRKSLASTLSWEAILG